MKKGMIVSFLVTAIWLAPLMTFDKAMAYESITATEAVVKWESNPDAVLLDVRSLEELHWVGSPAALDLQGNLVPISLVIPWNFYFIGDDGTVAEVKNKKFEKIVERNFLAKDQVIIIFCRSGGRSTDAALALEAMGYTEVFEIDTPGKGGDGGFQGRKIDGYRGYPLRLEDPVSWMDTGLPVTNNINPDNILTIKKKK